VCPQIIALVFELPVTHDFCNESPPVVLLDVLEQHPVTCRRPSEQLDCPCRERINGARIVLCIFVSVSMDLGDKRGGSRSMLLREPSNLSSGEESDPVRGLVVPILNGDNKAGGAVVVVKDEPVRSLSGSRHLEALMLELSLQFSDVRVSCLSLLASFSLSFMDAGNESLCDVHNGFGIFLVELEDDGGGAGRDRWCGGGRSEGSGRTGVGLI
jgi:hypothetical protein